MLDLDNAPKKATNLSLNAKTLEAARALGLNLSNTVDALLAKEVRRLYWERWNAENEQAIHACNERVATYGLPLAAHRTWGKSLGDGKSGKG